MGLRELGLVITSPRDNGHYAAERGQVAGSGNENIGSAELLLELEKFSRYLMTFTRSASAWVPLGR
jgi:hypothetical protein